MADVPVVPTVILLFGLPNNMVARADSLARKLGITLKRITIRSQGSPEFELKADVNKRTVQAFYDAYIDKGFAVIVLPYSTGIDAASDQLLDAMDDTGTQVRRPIRGASGWPDKPKSFDDNFMKSLMTSLEHEVTALTTPPVVRSAEDLAIIELLWALIRHSKMGANNHSHSADLWSSVKVPTTGGTRTAITNQLCRDGILGRKTNKSAGGDGWVYWIDNVPKALKRYPELEPIANSHRPDPR